MTGDQRRFLDGTIIFSVAINPFLHSLYRRETWFSNVDIVIDVFLTSVIFVNLLIIFVLAILAYNL